MNERIKEGGKRLTREYGTVTFVCFFLCVSSLRSRKYYKICKVFDHSHFSAMPSDANLSSDLSSRLTTELKPGFTQAKFPATYSSLRAVTCQGGRREKG